jgi:hypothetical protein
MAPADLTDRAALTAPITPSHRDSRPIGHRDQAGGLQLSSHGVHAFAANPSQFVFMRSSPGKEAQGRHVALTVSAFPCLALSASVRGSLAHRVQPPRVLGSSNQSHRTIEMDDEGFIAEYLRTRSYPPTEAYRERVRASLACYPDLDRSQEDRIAFLDRTMGNAFL